MLKFIEPMLKEAISGLKVGITLTLSSTGIPIAPPVVMHITALHFFFMLVITCWKTFKSEVGFPVVGSLA